MPLILEIWEDKQNRWKEINQLIPGDPPASISNYSIIGGREIYQIDCELDDSRSIIRQSMLGVDIDLPRGFRAVATEPNRLRKVRELRDGDEHEMTVMTDRMVVPGKLRLRHVEIDFGTRHCLLCEQEIPAPRYGVHVMREHSTEEFAEWPGGMVEFVAQLRRSINESVKKAKGFPRVQQHLRESLKLVSSLERRLKADRN